MRIPAAFAVAACLLCICISASSPACMAQAQQGSAANVQAAQGASTPLRVGGNVMQAQLLRMVTPNYPPAARAQGVSGDVVLHAVIGRDGSVKELQVVSGPQLLVYPAETAVKQWQYRPYLLNGRPIEVETTITVNFTLANGSSSAHNQKAAPQDGTGVVVPRTEGSAAPIDPQFKANILKLLDLMHATTLGQQVVRAMLQQMRPTILASMPPTPHREQIVDAYFDKLSLLLGSPDTIDRLAAIYARHFSPDDVNGMIQFYQTPVGQHTLAVMPQVASESQQVGSSVVQENLPRILQELCVQFPELRGQAKFCPATSKNESSERIEDKWPVVSGQWSAERNQ